MADSTSGTGSGTTAPSNERRLESWGEIASYLRREIRTVQRWEHNLGLPIHRLSVGKNASVYAYPSELDKWYKERETRLAKEDPEVDSSSNATNAPPNHEIPKPNPVVHDAEAKTGSSRNRLIAGALTLFLIGLLTAKYGGPLRDSIFPPKISFPIRLLVHPFNATAGERGSEIDSEGFTAEL